MEIGRSRGIVNDLESVLLLDVRFNGFDAEASDGEGVENLGDIARFVRGGND